MNEHINGYAIALYEIANEQKKQTKFKAIAIMLRSVIEKNYDLVHVLNAYELTQAQKLALITKVFKDYLTKEWMNFCQILAYRRKFMLILPILNKLIKLLNSNLNIKEGFVYSTILLTNKQLRAIINKTSELMNAKIELINKLDYSLISGIKVVVESQEFDYSLAARLKKLKSTMLYESEGQ